MKKIQSPNRQSGFTLIEIVFAMLITGIILGVIVTAIVSFNKRIIERKNQTILTTVQEELNRFLQNNGRYPCPAASTTDIEDADFGIERHADCTDATLIAGIEPVLGRDGRGIKIGAVPVRSLNLPDEFIFDAFGTRLLYAVTEELANSDTYNINRGAITINDTNGNPVVLPDGSAAYVVVSFGQNASGGFEGTTGVPIGGACNAALSPAELENCTNDDVFVRSVLQTDNIGDYFDDQVITKQGSGLGQAVPAGGLMYFDLTQCPRGWANYFGLPDVSGTIACRKL